MDNIMSTDQEDNQKDLIIQQLLESFSLQQLEFINRYAKLGIYGFMVLGLKNGQPDLVLFIPSLKLPKKV